MKAVVQRVAWARVKVDERVVGECGAGLLILLGVMRGDGEREAERLAGRVARYRVFPEAPGTPAAGVGRGRMAVSAVERGLSALVISQVTLAADGREGRRPSLDQAAPPAQAERIYLCFTAALRRAGLPAETGEFGAYMEVDLCNAGPVTLLLEESPGRPDS